MSLVSRIGSILRRRSPAELTVMFLDRMARPLGFSPISFTRYAVIPPIPTTDTPESKFEQIADANLWGSAESLSGRGSEMKQSARYRAALIDLIRERNFQSMFDAPCGDLNWMRSVLDKVHVEYLGGDISGSIIAHNQALYPDLKFVRFDITSDTFPAADVWHCRDCLFHLSYRDIERALRNFASSTIPFALITNHSGLVRNNDVETGGWRFLNLRRAPFRFPQPLAALPDYRFGDLPQIVGLWSRQQIIELVARLDKSS